MYALVRLDVSRLLSSVCSPCLSSSTSHRWRASLRLFSSLHFFAIVIDLLLPCSGAVHCKCCLSLEVRATRLAVDSLRLPDGVRLFNLAAKVDTGNDRLSSSASFSSDSNSVTTIDRPFSIQVRFLRPDTVAFYKLVYELETVHAYDNRSCVDWLESLDGIVRFRCIAIMNRGPCHGVRGARAGRQSRRIIGQRRIERRWSS